MLFVLYTLSKIAMIEIGVTSIRRKGCVVMGFVLMSCFVLGGCKDLDSSSALGASGAGSIAGQVVLFDSTSVPLTDYSGTMVRVDSTSLSTVTDVDGRWTLASVPVGLHDITVSKPGFGAYHWYERNINGGVQDLEHVALSRMSNHHITIGAGWSGLNADPGLEVWSDSVTSNVYTCAYYFDLDSNVQPSDPHFKVGRDRINYESLYELRTAGVKSGQTLYMSASTVFLADGWTGGFVTQYFDPKHNEERWASTGPKSNVVAVRMP